jgi:protein SCO1/2
MKISLLFVAIVTGALLIFLGYKAYEQYISDKPSKELAIFGPVAIDSSGTEINKKYHIVPDFEFLDQDSQKITKATFKDKIYVTDFFFTTCEGICPKMTNQMERVNEAFEKEPRVCILSHTVNPEFDSVTVLREYAREHDADSDKWHFVTGDKAKIYNMARTGYFVADPRGDAVGEDFVHTENFALVDKEGMIRGYYDGTDSVAVNKLIVDIRQLLKYYDYYGK